MATDPIVLYVRLPAYLPGTRVVVYLRQGNAEWRAAVIPQMTCTIAVNFHAVGLTSLNPAYLFSVFLDDGSIELLNESHLKEEMKEL